MKIFTSQGKWENVAADAGFQDGILTVGGDTDRKIVVKGTSNEILGIFGKDGIELNTATFQNIYANNIITKQETAITLTVSNSIKDTLDSIPKYLERDVTIKIPAGTFEEVVNISGFKGRGSLIFQLDAGTIINGGIYVFGCDSVKIQGNNATLNHTDSTKNAIFVKSTVYFDVHSLVINGRGDGGVSDNPSFKGVYVLEGTHAKIENCCINNFCGPTTPVYYAAIGADIASQIYSINNKGSNNTSPHYADRGSIIAGGGTCPHGTEESKTGYGGQLIGTWTMKAADGTAVKPVVSKSVVYNANSFTFWRTTLKKWQQGIYIGDFSKSTGGSGTGGNNLAVFGIDLAKIRTDLRGKTIKSVKVAIRREAEGGYDTKVAPYLGLTTSLGSGSAPTVLKSWGSLGDFTKGQLREVMLPVSVINDIITNTTANNLILYRPDEKQYSIWVKSLQLHVTYEEPATISEDIPMVVPEIEDEATTIPEI